MKEIQIGKTGTLTVLRTSEHGVYLGKRERTGRETGSEAESVLLPKGQVPEGLKIGDEIPVFVYRDSEDRPIATVKRPYAEVGEFAYLTVKAVTKLGAFLDWGLEKDLFLPYKEMEEPVKSGQNLMVRLYLDKSGRISASTKLYGHLSEAESPAAEPSSAFRKEDAFEGAVYRVNPEVGVFIAVSPKGERIEAGRAFGKLFFGLLPPSEVFQKYRLGDKVSGRIMRVRTDGKLDLSLRKRAFLQLDSDGEKILNKIREYGGTLPFSESASPELIKRELQMSKAAFKNAVGHLYKKRMIRIGEKEISLA